MALVKELTSRHGFVATDGYVRVRAIRIDYAERSVEVALGLYKSKADRQAGAEPFEERHYSLAGGGFNAFIQAVQGGTAPRAVVYTWVKANVPDMSGAADDKD